MMGTLRGIVLGLLALALWNPSLPGGRSPLDVVLVTDRSPSLSPDQRRTARDRVAAWHAELPEGSRLIDRPGDPAASDLGADLRAALHAAAPGRDTRVLLLTDGGDTGGSDTGGGLAEALAAARDAGLPVAAADLGRLPGPPGDALTGLAAPDHLPAGRALALAVTLQTGGAKAAAVSLALDGLPAGALAEAAPATGPRALVTRLPAPAPGVRTLSAALDGGADGRRRATALVTVDGPRPVMVVGRSAGTDDLVRALAALGHPVEQRAPGDLAALRPDAALPAAIVLDNLAVADAGPVAWQRLAQAVTRQGTGLVVLGGDRSFGAGGYRGSVLESLLPVTAQARRPDGQRSVLFLTDKSGSMGRNEGGATRFDTARRAVMATARDLTPRDRAGLSWFDAAARAALPLGAADDPAARLAAAWTERPGGGTDLGRALAGALDTLAAQPPGRRILVVTTDGFSDSALPPGLADTVAAADIEVLALLIGEAAPPAGLAELARAGGGRLVPVADLADLPRLMRAAVSAPRAPIRPGPVALGPAAVDSPLPPGPWPALGGLAETRPRPDSRLLLAAADGAPVIALADRGLGRVLALPGGLGDWAAAWRGRADWPALVGALTGLVAAADRVPGLSLSVRPTARGLDIRLEGQTADGIWRDDLPDRLLVAGPTGDPRALDLHAVAPGLRTAQLATPARGRFDLAPPGAGPRLAVMRDDRAEWAAAARGGATLETLARDGLLALAPLDGPAPWTPAWRPIHTRPGLLLAAFLLYLALLMRERLGPVAGWPAALFGRTGKAPEKALP